MYKAYFGLSDNPFSITPDPRYLYLSPRHKEALAHLLYGITQRGGFIQLTGEVGTGKTTLTRALLEQLPENTDLALILNPKVSVEEFLASVCEEFRIIETGTKLSIKEYVDKLTAFLLEQYSKGLHTVVLIDEAQNLTFDVIEQVRLLTNIETAQSKLLQIILVGQPELVEHLNNRRLRQVAQRVTARYHLIPLTMAETAGYIKHRLRVAGVDRPLFTPAAMRLIKIYSGGIPRLINIICDRALLGTYATNKMQVDSKVVTKAAMEVKGGKLVDFGAPIRALKNRLRSRSNVKTDVDAAEINIQPKTITKTKAKTKVETKEDKSKPRRVVKVKKVSSKTAASTTSSPIPNSPVLEEPKSENAQNQSGASVDSKTIINESEASAVEKIGDELERKQEEKIADDKAAIAVGELEQERVAAGQAAEKAEKERLEAERQEAERIAAEKAEQERLEAERLEAERIAAEKAEQERLEAERLETERIAAEKAEQERLEAERLEAERIAAEKAEQERLEAERLEVERIAAEKAEQERLEAERLETERVAAEKAEQERLEAERQEAERIAVEKAEQEKLEAEQELEITQGEISEEELENKVEEMFSEADDRAETAEEKLAEDVEFGELVEDFDAPSKVLEPEEEEVTEVENFDIYAPDKQTKEVATTDESVAKHIQEEAPKQEENQNDEQKHQYDSEDLEEEIDDDLAFELKDDNYQEPVNESEILNGDEKDASPSKLKIQIKEQIGQVKDKAAKAARSASAGVLAGAKKAEAGVKAGAKAGSRASAKVVDKVKNGASSINIEGFIAKAKMLGKKEKIAIGSGVAVFAIVVGIAISMSGSDSSVKPPESSKQVVENAADKNDVVVTNKAKKHKDNIKATKAKTVKPKSDISKAVKIKDSKKITPVTNMEQNAGVKKVEVKTADTDQKTVDKKPASLTNMVSSLQGLFGNDAEVKSTDSLEKQNNILTTSTAGSSETVQQITKEDKEKAVVTAKPAKVEPVAEKTEKKKVAKVKKAVVKKSKLERALLNKSLDKGLATSFKELFKLWRLDYDKAKGKTACEKSKSKGLNCFFNAGSVNQLIRFNRPVIMKFEKTKGFNYALLVKLSKKSATLDFGGEFKKFSTSDLKKVWKGKYITLWRPPKLNKMIIKPGEEGDHVRWLSMMMDMYDGKKTPRIDRKIYNDALRKRVEVFQKDFNLAVDGIVGKSTMAYMTSAVSFPGVPLLKNNR